MDVDETLLGSLRPLSGRTAVRFERTYRTTATDLWSAVTDPARVGRWLAPLSGDLQPGGGWRLDFGDDESSGTVLRCQPPHLLEVSWDFPGEPTSRVTVQVAPGATAEGGPSSHLVLEHVLLPGAQAAGYGAGWHAHLDGLAAELQDGPPAAWDEVFAAVLPRYRSRAAGTTGAHGS